MERLACLPLIEADIPAVLALDERCLGGLWTRSGYQRELDSDCSDLFVLVSIPELNTLSGEAFAENRTCAAIDPHTESASNTALSLLGIGCLWAILEEAHITTLAIDPKCQRLQLGQLLLAQLLRAAQRRGLTRATLEVRESNEPALGLYQKFGFKTAGVRKRYYADGENACILWRSGLADVAVQATFNDLLAEAVCTVENTKRYIFLQTLHLQSSRTA